MFFNKFDFDPDPEMDQHPDPELPEKLDRDPEIIFSDPTHCRKVGPGSGSASLVSILKKGVCLLLNGIQHLKASDEFKGVSNVLPYLFFHMLLA